MYAEQYKPLFNDVKELKLILFQSETNPSILNINQNKNDFFYSIYQNKIRNQVEPCYLGHQFMQSTQSINCSSRMAS
jgi:hypothetical protein